MAATCLHRVEEALEAIQQLDRQAEATVHQASEADKDTVDKAATHRLVVPHPSNMVLHRRADILHPNSTVPHRVVLLPNSMVLLPAAVVLEDVHRLLLSNMVPLAVVTVTVPMDMVPTDMVHLGKKVVHKFYRWNDLQIPRCFAAHPNSMELLLNSMVPQAMVTDMDRMVAPGKWQISAAH